MKFLYWTTIAAMLATVPAYANGVQDKADKARTDVSSTGTVIEFQPYVDDVAPEKQARREPAPELFLFELVEPQQFDGVYGVAEHEWRDIATLTGLNPDGDRAGKSAKQFKLPKRYSLMDNAKMTSVSTQLQDDPGDGVVLAQRENGKGFSVQIIQGRLALVTHSCGMFDITYATCKPSDYPAQLEARMYTEYGTVTLELDGRRVAVSRIQ